MLQFLVFAYFLHTLIGVIIILNGRTVQFVYFLFLFLTQCVLCVCVFLHGSKKNNKNKAILMCTHILCYTQNFKMCCFLSFFFPYEICKFCTVLEL